MRLDPLLEVAGLFVLTQCAQVGGKIVSRTQGRGVVIAQHPAPAVLLSHGHVDHTWSVTPGRLPAGLTLSPAGAISGRSAPTAQHASQSPISAHVFLWCNSELCGHSMLAGGPSAGEARC